MKTWQAALSHIGLAAVQASAGALFFKPDTFGGAMANTQIQLGTQVGLSLLQGWLAKKNSNTDPNGNKLVQVNENKFISSEK